MIYWQQTFGTDQWVSVKMKQITGCNGFGLLLKASGNSTAGGLVNVSYNRCASPKLIIYSFSPLSNNWVQFGGAVVTLSAGDVLKARVQANGLVSVYYNGTLLVSTTLPSANAGFDTGRAGQIGLATSNATVILDDFDGGTQ